MNTTIHIFSPRYIWKVASLLVIVFLYESAGSEFFHNHKPDINEQDNCPVAMLHSIVHTGIVVYTNVPHDQIVEYTIPEIPIRSFSESYLLITTLRGPPIN